MKNGAAKTRAGRKRRPVQGMNPVKKALLLNEIFNDSVSLRIHVYLTEQGQVDRRLLARLAWFIGLGAETLFRVEPGSDEGRRLHADLRAVVELSCTGGAWRTDLAPHLDESVALAARAVCKHPLVAKDISNLALTLARKVEAGAAQMDDIHGDEIFSHNEKEN